MRVNEAVAELNSRKFVPVELPTVMQTRADCCCDRTRIALLLTARAGDPASPVRSRREASQLTSPHDRMAN